MASSLYTAADEFDAQIEQQFQTNCVPADEKANSVACQNTKPSYDDWKLEKVTVYNGIEVLDDAYEVVVQTIIDENITTQSVDVVIIPNQGMTNGLFSSVQCYQFNSRYTALINLICTNTYSTIAMTLEYLVACLVLMVTVEFLKRWARPYNDDYADGSSGGEEMDLEGNPIEGEKNGKWTTAFN